MSVTHKEQTKEFFIPEELRRTGNPVLAFLWLLREVMTFLGLHRKETKKETVKRAASRLLLPAPRKE
ncbi:MAG: hypothetical protein V1763_01105 [Parcubacteria group bacterium]